MTRSLLGPALAPLLGLLLGPTAVSAQFAHYWGDHFGNESLLLNGAVIGSVTDAGAVFYNPARLLHQEAPSFVASARLYEWTEIRVKDGLGDGRNLEQVRFGGAPGFIVGTFTLPFLDGHQFAYGVLTRHRANVRFNLREERRDRFIPSLPGTDTFVGFANVENRYDDDWVGLSWAWEAGRNVSLGASLFYYDRSFGRTLSVDLRAIGEDLDAAGLELERIYSTRDRGVVAKLGLAWRGGAWSAGVSATTPYAPLSSSASLRYETFGFGLADADGAPVDNVLESSVQSDLPMTWRTPWSFGAGVGFAAGNWHFHLAAEYYLQVPEHVLLESSDAVFGQSTGDPIEFTVLEKRKRVLNGGLGLRYRATSGLSAFASVVSNRSSAPDDATGLFALESVTSHTNQQMSFVLVGGGLSIRTRWADLTVGATWQGSREPVRRLFALPEVPVEDPQELATLKLDEWRLLLGFSVPFVDERLGGLGNLGGE